MKALLYAEGGNLDHLFDEDNKIHQIIAENWVRSEKLMYKIDDESYRPPSPIRIVKRIPHLHLTCDSTVESVGENGPLVTTQELKELIKKRVELLELADNIKKMKQDERDKAIERLGVGKEFSPDFIVQNIIRNNTITPSRSTSRSKPKSKPRRR